MQAGFRTRNITTVAITAKCRNVTHSANLHDDDDDDDDYYDDNDDDVDDDK